MTLERRDAPQHDLGSVDGIKDSSVAHLNTFEKLNEQIQQSIASLKKMNE